MSLRPSKTLLRRLWRRRADNAHYASIGLLRESFDLPGAPIRITLREKKNPYAGRKKG